MDQLEIKIIQTIIAFIAYAVLRMVSGKFVDKTVATSFMQKTRGKIAKKAVNLLLLFLLFAFISILWGVDKRQLAIFVGSVLTVIGIALVAQWSILSNITAGIILFFNHSVKLDDTIAIIDKDFNVEGRVSDIGLFFVILKSGDGERVSIPNNVFIQKMIKLHPN